MEKCPKCGHEFEGTTTEAVMAPTPLVGEEWLRGVPGGSSETQVAHFAAKGYGVHKRAVAETHAGKPYDGGGPVAYLGDGPGRLVACLFGSGDGRWWLGLFNWGHPWSERWRFSVYPLPPAQ